MELVANRLSKQAHNKLYHGKQLRAMDRIRTHLKPNSGIKDWGTHTCILVLSRDAHPAVCAKIVNIVALAPRTIMFLCLADEPAIPNDEI